MFPNQNIISDTTQLVSTSTSSGKTLKFDFNTGDFVVEDGKVVTVTKSEAVKMWLTKILKTEKNKYKIYNNDNIQKYGASLLEIVTSKYPKDYIFAQVQTIITEIAKLNEDIVSVSDFKFIKDKKLLNVSFTVNTVYGVTESEVII